MEMITECPSCPLAQYVLRADDYVQHEIADRRNETIPDTRDNWTRENVKRAANDSMHALTKGQARRASIARNNAAQGFIRIVDEPVRALIQECTPEELTDILVELRNIISELHASADKKLRNLRRRFIRIARWIELELAHPGYKAPRELTDNEFVLSVIREFNRKGM
jgi:ABC-type phosphate transport system ATPase subunit